MTYRPHLSLTALRSIQKKAASSASVPDDPDKSYIDYFYDEPGSVPGTLYIEEDSPPTTIVLIDYDEEKVSRRQVETPEQCLPYLETESVSWVDVKGLGSEEILHRLGQVFQLHSLVLEDIVNVPQRPKFEEFEADQL
ncbi:MAG: hypothetical protein JO235_16805, partial [Chroococcidiopsidaceae cyanobacterium CP_BM_RX_35]|nr:hypothetical protein [Chroococcidiopsidaceae cyanobacterium CP_BM_RX_35]